MTTVAASRSTAVSSRVTVSWSVSPLPVGRRCKANARQWASVTSARLATPRSVSQFSHRASSGSRRPQVCSDRGTR